MDQVKSAIIATLCYSDIFDFPLTKAELWRYLIMQHEKIMMQNFEKGLVSLVKTKKIGFKEGYYFLPKRSGIVAKRKERKKISEKKFARIKEVVRFLQKIPTVNCIGISGSLAVMNAEKNADIDLFVITQKNSLWVTRLLLLSVLEIKGLRRKWDAKKTANTFCLNMLIDTNHLVFAKNRHNMYTARELVQMKPLFSRGLSYEKFLKHNAWIDALLPHAFPKTALKHLPYIQKEKISRITFLEPLAKFFQLWYMKRHTTTEIIRDGFVAFHPQDYTKSILATWEARKKQYGV